MIVNRAISLTQPWATLMAIGAKGVETRSWKTVYRGWIAIHAAKAFPLHCKTLCRTQPFASSLAKAGIEDLNSIPLGCVIAVVSLVKCLPAEMLTDLPWVERAFGDYSSGRYGFLCSDLRRLREPIPMKGALGIWRLDRPIRDEDLI